MFPRKYRFEFKRRRRAKTVLAEVKRILEDPKNFTQGTMRRYDSGEVVRVCTLGAIETVAGTKEARNRAASMLSDALRIEFGTGSIAAINDGERAGPGRGKKERARNQIINAIERSLTA